VIQGLPPLTVNTSVPIGFFAGIDGNYIISIDSLDNFPFDMTIILEDLTTQKKINLRKEVYSFSTLQGEHNNRFVVHIIKESTDLKLYKNEVNPDIIISGNTLTFNSVTDTEYFLEVTDMLGHRILTKNLYLKGVESIQLPEIKGTYLLKITEKGTNRHLIKKIVIN